MTHEKNMMDYLDWIEKKGMCFKDENFVTTFEDALKYTKILEQRNFLKSQPKLGDFVPTNEDGEVMEYPKRKSLEGMSDADAECAIDQHEGLEIEYYEAKEKVIWKGWEWRKYSDTESMYDLKHKDCSKDIAHKNRGVITFHYSDTTYNELITSGGKLERIQKK